MKNKIRISAILLIISIIALALTSCGENVAYFGNATVVIENKSGEYQVFDIDLSKLDSRDEGVISLLEYLCADEENNFSFSASWGAYGAYLTAVGDISEDKMNGKYIYVYTSFGDNYDTSVWVRTVSYGDIVLKTSGVGVSKMTVKDGTIILFRIEGF